MIEKQQQEIVDGAAIERARSDAGMTQEDLSQKAIVSLRTVQRAEKSDPKITYKTARKIAKALSVPISTVLPGAEDMIYVSQPKTVIMDDMSDEPPEWFVQYVEQQQAFQADVLNRLELLLEQTAP